MWSYKSKCFYTLSPIALALRLCRAIFIIVFKKQKPLFINNLFHILIQKPFSCFFINAL